MNPNTTRNWDLLVCGRLTSMGSQTPPWIPTCDFWIPEKFGDVGGCVSKEKFIGFRYEIRVFTSTNIEYFIGNLIPFHFENDMSQIFPNRPL